MPRRKAKTAERRRRPTAEEIAKRADRGEDISAHFTNRGEMMPPAIQRVNVDFSVAMLEELDATARELNISRQAVIKSFVRQSLDDHYRAAAYRRSAHEEGH
ncbi:MAG: antitoxin [Deltaproteobacteria bacterium]|nr:antitoxin [Deltaproteobacteria bacterium]